MIKLLGIVLVAVGFAFRVNTLLVVLVGGLVTGLLAGFTWHELLGMIGQFFVEQRNLTLAVILMMPVIGLLEKHGLREQVARLVRRARAATPGGVLWLYQAIRGLSSMVGLSIGNHASMARPLIAPMAEAAAREARRPLSAGRDGPVTEARPGAQRDEVRAHAAAAENVGNFFSDDIVVAIGALLLVRGFFETAGVEVALRDIKLWSLPTAVAVLFIGGWRYRRLNARLRAQGEHAKK